MSKNKNYEVSEEALKEIDIDKYDKEVDELKEDVKRLKKLKRRQKKLKKLQREKHYMMKKIRKQDK